MTVNFSVFNKEGTRLVQEIGSACFSQLPRYKPDMKDPDNYLIYYPEIARVSVKSPALPKKLAIDYLDNLTLMGFKFKQSGREILKDGYRLDFKDFVHGKNKFPSLSEIGMHLTAIRYVQEYSLYIGRYFNLLDIDPKMDKLEAFQLAHFVPVIGQHTFTLCYGAGHNLAQPGPLSSYIPFKSWETIQKEAASEDHAWHDDYPMFHIHQLFGKDGKCTREFMKVTDKEWLQTAYDYFKT